MKYYSAIIFLCVSSFFSVILLLYFANISRNIEKENSYINENINFIKEQININEIEYSLYNSYEYLQKIQKIYFIESDKKNFNNRVTYLNFKNKNIGKFYTVGTK